MTGEFAVKPEVRPPSLTGCRENYLISGVSGGSERNPRHQIAEAYQVVGRGGEGEHPAHPLHASVPGFPEIAHGFHPAEDFLYPFPQALADGVGGMPGSASVNGRASALPGHMGHGPEGAKPSGCGSHIDGPPLKLNLKQDYSDEGLCSITCQSR
jgi:hypothetical protein